MRNNESFFVDTVDPVYSERVSSHRSLIYSQIKYVYKHFSEHFLHVHYKRDRLYYDLT
jgi:hypothetical protein